MATDGIAVANRLSPEAPAVPQEQAPPPYQQPAEAVLASLATDARRGLSDAEARRGSNATDRTR